MSPFGLDGITFGPNGQLYGVVKFDKSNNPMSIGTVVLIDRNTGAVTDSGWATAGKNVPGHAIEYNPFDDLLYHFYPTGAMETIDPDTDMVTTGGAVSGDIPSFITGVQYEGNGNFLLSDSFYDFVNDIGRQKLFRITSAGQSSIVTQIGVDNNPFFVDGIALGASVDPPVVDPPVVDPPVVDPPVVDPPVVTPPTTTPPLPNTVNTALKTKLTQDLAKLKKKLKKLKKSGNKKKLKKLKKKEKALKKSLSTL